MTKDGRYEKVGSFKLPSAIEVATAGDEIWIRANGTRMTVSDMHVDHARNALRHILKAMRTAGKVPQWLQRAMDDARTEDPLWTGEAKVGTGTGQSTMQEPDEPRIKTGPKDNKTIWS
jgi:hypothetical protein